MRKIMAIGAILALTGCANGFEKHYHPAPPAGLVSVAPSLDPPPPKPAVYVISADIQEDAKRLAKDGYVFIGESSFVDLADRSREAQAVMQGKRVGASVVLFKSEFKDTRSDTIPYTVSSATKPGTGASTPPGGYSTFAREHSLDRDTFYASYWAKRDPNKIQLGLNYGPLSDALRQRLERNTGVQVDTVVRGTPAFNANFLEGDILLKMNGKDITDVSTLSSGLIHMGGQLVTFDLLRSDEPRTIAVTLNP
jgi:hypothetical protein